MSQRVDGSLWRESSHRETCWWQHNHSVLVARCGEKAVIRRRVLVEATSQRVGGPLWREGSYREMCVGGREITACWWLALAHYRCCLFPHKLA